jgi:hypothetical protein
MHMTSFSWATAASGDWNTGTLWTGGIVPNSATADVTIDVTAMPPAAYTVTIGAGESFTVDSLTINDTEASAQGANSNPQTSAELELDGTLTFAPGSAGIFGNHEAAGGSLQTTIYTDSGDDAEIVNAGTIDGFIQVQGGNLLLTGTNGVYITNELQVLGGTATIDTTSIAEITGNTLFDGIFEAIGPSAAVVDLGGSLEGLVVNIGTVEGPSNGGWTELTVNGPNTEINQWNGTAYVPIETTLTEIEGGATVDVLTGRDYTTTNTLTIDAGVGNVEPGMLNLQAGTVTTGGLVINGGIVQGSATIVGGVVNDGTLIALGGTMDLTGGLTGTGTVEFDFDRKELTLDATGATLVVNAVSAGQTVTMNGDDTLVLATPSAFVGTIAAKVGDQIILDGLTATGAALNNGTLLVSNGSVVVASLALVGNYSGDSFITSGSIVTLGALVAPTISGTSAGQTTTDQTPIKPFSGVTIADLSAGQTESVTITVSAPANGTLSAPDGGTYNATTGVYTVTGSASAVTTAVDALVFTPTQNEVTSGGTVATGFTIQDTDTAGITVTDTTTSVIVTVPPQVTFNSTDGTSFVDTFDPVANVTEIIEHYSGPNSTGTLLSKTVNNAAGTSYLFLYSPVNGVTQTVSVYSGPSDTGTQISQVVNYTDGTAAVFQYNPTATATQTFTQYSSFDPTTGAPTGSVTADVVDFTNGTAAIYQYDPSSTVTQTFTQYSSFDPTTGAPTGTETADVVNFTDGTVGIYQYNPSATVTMNYIQFSSYDPTGAPTGTPIAQVVDNADGTSILYAYSPTSSVMETAQFYSATNSSNGAPAGTMTMELFDYTTGGSSMTTGGVTTYYTGANGTGSVTSGPPSDIAVVAFTGSNQTIDPGAGNNTIQFITGQTADTVVLHAGGSDQIIGFNPGAGDMLDLSAMLSAANVTVSDITQLSKYVSIVNDNNSAQVLFDPTGQGGGSQVALLVNDSGLVAQLQTLKSFKV